MVQIEYRALNRPRKTIAKSFIELENHRKRQIMASEDGRLTTGDLWDLKHQEKVSKIEFSAAQRRVVCARTLVCQTIASLALHYVHQLALGIGQMAVSSSCLCFLAAAAAAANICFPSSSCHSQLAAVRSSL